MNAAFRLRLTVFGGAMLLVGALAAGCTGDEESPAGDGGSSATGAGGMGGSGGAGGSTSGGQASDDDGDGFSEQQGDCNDNDAQVHPDAAELCGDNIDNNCNGTIDDNEPDGDGDGFGPCAGDCDDGDPNVNPVADEIPGDGIDNNCDGVTDADLDGDGYGEVDGDCNDADPAVNPGATELCFDGVDNNCNGFSDADEPDVDNDGFGPCAGDCDDSDPDVGPNQPEIPNDGIDNNCDNLVDLDVDGDGWTTENGDCDDGDPAVNPAAIEDCNNGVDDNCDGNIDSDCLTPCELAEVTRSSVGCVYYAVDSDTLLDALQYAVVVSNIDDTDSASVEVQTKNGGVWQTLQQANVAPQALHQFNLPDRQILDSGLNVAGAYRVVSDLPVIAYQFQPVDGQSSNASDASLLLPTSAHDQYYYVVGWGPSVSTSLNPLFHVVATSDTTNITIIPSVSSLAGPGNQPPAMSAGTSYDYVLDDGDYLQIANGANQAFTGTYITSDKPIMVISAHECANIPLGHVYCDHLEEVMPGLQTWGNLYVASRFPARDTANPEASQWQIFASEDNTQVNFIASPEVTGLPPSPQTLNAGGVLELDVGGTVANPGDFVVSADKPIFVMEYLSSESYVPAVPQDLAGDPAMTQMVPTEQYLDNYVVLVPLNWIYDFMVITKPVGATVQLDGSTILQTDFTAIDDGINPPQWEVARVAVTDGVHVLDGSHPFGVVVLGYDAYDSYAYPGGLNQQIINPVN